MKSILITFFLSLCYFGSQAQIFIMPRGGATFSNVSFSDSLKRNNGQNSRFNLGSTFGVSVNIPVSGPFSVQPELYYSQKGFKLVSEDFNTGSEETSTQKVILNYIELPVMASLQFGTENVQAIINAGPYIGFGIGGKFKNKYEFKDITTPSNSSTLEEEFNIKFGKQPVDSLGVPTSTDVYVDNRLDFGFQAGLGVGIAAGPGFIVFEERYVMGFGNLFDKPTSGTGKVKAQNRNFYFSLGYTILLGSGSNGSDELDEEGGGERKIRRKNLLSRFMRRR